MISFFTKSNTEQELVVRLQSGDTEAFSEFVAMYYSKLFSHAYSILMNKHDAEDVVQESLFRVHNNIETFKGESSFSTWLYRIVRNMAVDSRRKKARRGGETQELKEDFIKSDHLIERTTPSDELHRQQEVAKLQEALESLSSEHREAVVLREIDGLSYHEIADLTGVTKGTVMSRLFYARKRLQKFFTEDGEENL
jgi:RNA polymerase sigma-70 factor, ECF subfamily